MCQRKMTSLPWLTMIHEIERNIEKPSVTSLPNNSMTHNAAEKAGATIEEMEPAS